MSYIHIVAFITIADRLFWQAAKGSASRKAVAWTNSIVDFLSKMVIFPNYSREY